MTPFRTFLATTALCLAPLASQCGEFDPITEAAVEDILQWTGLLDACDPDYDVHEDRAISDVASALARTKAPSRFAWAIGARNAYKASIEQDMIYRHTLASFQAIVDDACPSASDMEAIRNQVTSTVNGLIFAHNR